MTARINAHGQPIGYDVPDWQPRPRPAQTDLIGRYADCVALCAVDHADDLYAAFCADTDGAMWTYMPVGPFQTRADFDQFLASIQDSTDPLFYAIIDKATGKALGFASYLRIDPAMGVIEVGFIAMAPALQKTRVATEAMFLMMAHVFDDLGYRRYEWKCDDLNGPSKRAAERFGFQANGVFPQATIYKGRNRDTAWFAILDKDWPRVKAGFDAWLSAGNFDDNGLQKTRLAITR